MATLAQHKTDELRHRTSEMLRLWRATAGMELEFRFEVPDLVRKETLARVRRAYGDQIVTTRVYDERRTRVTSTVTRHVKYVRDARTSDVFVDEKTNLYHADHHDLFCTLALSLERSVCASGVRWRVDAAATDDELYAIIRTNVPPLDDGWVRKWRRSYRVSDRYRLDVTATTERVFVELEVVADTNVDDMLRAASDVVRAVVGTDLARGTYDALRTVVLDTKHLAARREMHLARGKYQKPVVLPTRRYLGLFDGRHWVTPKMDGVRRFLIFANGRVYAYTPAMEVLAVPGLGYTRRQHAATVDGTYSVVDVELVDGSRYWIIDVPVMMGVYVGDDGDGPLHRTDAFLAAYDVRVSHPVAALEVKPYVRVSGHTLSDVVRAWIAQLRERIDGIVFASAAYSGSCYKLKPARTVDLRYGVAADGSIALTASGGERIDHGSVAADVPLVHDRIYEFDVDVASRTFTATRDRSYDRIRPNAYAVVQKILSDDIAPFDVVHGVGALALRKMHNIAKTEMYAIHVPKRATILDVGTGQGGDVSKWPPTSDVYCVEPSRTAIDELVRRIAAAQTRRRCGTRKVVAARIANSALVAQSVPPVDAIVLFFCINLFAKDDFRGLLHIVRTKTSHASVIVGSYMVPPTHAVHDECCEITVGSEGTYRITIHGTRIQSLDERTVDFVALSARLQRLRYRLVAHGVMRPSSDIDSANLCPAERRLMLCYRSFVFARP